MGKFSLTMRAQCFWLAAVCAVAVAEAAALAEDHPPVKFRGVTPGKTSLEQVRQNEKWGHPLGDGTRRPNGAVLLEFRIEPWEKVVAVVQNGIVRIIDATPPPGIGPGELARTLRLGEVRPIDSLPANARLGEPVNPDWEMVECTGGLAVLFTTEVDGERRVKLVRLYSQTKPVPPVLSAPPPAPSSAPPPAPVPAEERTAPGESTEGAGAVEAPDAKHRRIVQAVLGVIKQHHVSGHPLDDEIARRTLERLLSSFDPDKLYFMQSDVDRFRRAGTTLADQLRRGDVSLAQDVQGTFLERLRQRVELVYEFLEMEHDFTVDERLAKRDAAEYAESDRETRERWRKLVKYRLLLDRAAGADAAEARRRIIRKYRDFVGLVELYDLDDALDALLDSFAGSFDPHSSYMPPRQLAEKEIMLRRELFGIGAALLVEDGYVKVGRVIPNGPAARGGQLKAGDRILAVGEGEDGELADVVGVRLPDVVDRIRGPQGTVVRLQVLPAGRFESSLYRITRDKVEVTNLAGAVLSGESLPEGREAKVGYVYMPTFYQDRKAKAEGRDDYRSSARDLRRLLEDFTAQGADVLLLDVRQNQGGVLSEVIETAGLFVGKGPVVQAKDRNGKIKVYAPQTSSVAWHGSLVVLTSKVSAAGTETLAGALADYHRGLIVGDPHTNGMGTSASLFDLGSRLFQIPNPPQLGSVQLTMQKLYRPSGEGIQLRGVVPQVILPSMLELVTALGQDSRPYSLGHDAIAQATFTPLDFSLDAKLPQLLNTRSEERRRDSAYFQKLAARIEQEKAKRESTHVSLKEDDFLAERSQAAPEDDWPTVPGIAEVKLDPYLNEVLAITLDYTAYVNYTKAAKLYTEKQYDQAIELYKRTVRANPTLANAHYMLAWSLGTCPEARVRDGDTAIEHARRACELDTENRWTFLLALAVAEAEAGRFDDALRDLKQALALAPDAERSKYEYLISRFEAGQPFQSR